MVADTGGPSGQIYIGTNLNLDPQNWIIEENSMPRLHRLKSKVLNSSGANFDLTW